MKLSRRDLLRSAGGAALAPLVPILLEDEARAASIPKRLIVIGQCHGVGIDPWKPVAAAGGGWALGPSLAPLGPYKDRIVMVDGLGTYNVSDSPVNDDHGNAARALFTGWVDKTATSRGAALDAVSFDQIVAEKVTSTDNLFSSLQFGVHSFSVPMFYKAVAAQTLPGGVRRGVPLASTNKPSAMFDRIYGGGGRTDDPIKKRAIAQRSAALKYVKPQLDALMKRLGRENRQKVASHLESVNALEMTLQKAAANSCTPPALGPAETTPAMMRAQLTMMANALICDLTRVVSLKWGGDGGGAHPTGGSYDWLGLTEEWHTIAHTADARFVPKANKDAANAKIQTIMQWHAGEVRLLLDQLAEAKEADGSSVLDNTLLAWACCLGGNHQKEHAAVMLLGGARTKLRGGRSLVYDRMEKRCPNDLWAPLLRLFDVEVSTFGDPGRFKGPLPDLL